MALAGLLPGLMLVGAMMLGTSFACLAQAQAPLQQPTAPTIVEINTATEAELDSIRGVGPPMTRALLAARANGPYADWPDLMRRVKGIGAVRARQWSQNGVRVGGAAFGPDPQDDRLKSE